MAQPVFLSSCWQAGKPHPAVDELDRQLRLRGVPVWRDIRDFGAGGFNEDVAYQAITQTCCGLILHFTEPVLKSWFINSVELRALRYRLDRDADFFVASVFDGVGGDETRALANAVGVDMRAFQGFNLDPNDPTPPQLMRFSGQVLDSYIERAERPTNVRVETRDQIPWSDEAGLQLNWEGLLGDDREPPRHDVWDELPPAIQDVRQALQKAADERLLEIRGSIHLSAAFLIGWEFREATGWGVMCQHPRAAATAEAVAGDAQGWSLSYRASQNDSDELLVRVGMAQDPAQAVLQHRSAADLARAELSVLPPDGSPTRTAADGTDLNALAIAVVEKIKLARSQYGVARSELYLACPWSFALLLGWHFASSGSFRVYEATPDKATYYDNPLSLP